MTVKNVHELTVHFQPMNGQTWTLTYTLYSEYVVLFQCIMRSRGRRPTDLTIDRAFLVSRFVSPPLSKTLLTHSSSHPRGTRQSTHFYNPSAHSFSLILYFLPCFTNPPFCSFNPSFGHSSLSFKLPLSQGIHVCIASVDVFMSQTKPKYEKPCKLNDKRITFFLLADETKSLSLHINCK